MSVVMKRPQAKLDMVKIWQYIAADSEINADNFIRGIEKKLHTLASQPAMGECRDQIKIGLRCFPIGNYIIFYRMVPEGVLVVRVVHGARDISKMVSSLG